MDLHTVWYVIAALLVVVGIAGIVLPALPGIPLIFAGMLLAAAVDGFERVQWWWIVVLGVLALISVAIDFWATAIGAKRVGASRKALIGAVVGTLVGLFFAPIGIIVGPFAGAALGELWHGRRMDKQGLGQATKVGVGTWLGIVFGVAVKLALAGVMIALFLWAWYR